MHYGRPRLFRLPPRFAPGGPQSLQRMRAGLPESASRWLPEDRPGADLPDGQPDGSAVGGRIPRLSRATGRILRPAPLYLPSNDFPEHILSAWAQEEKPDVILTMHLQVKHWVENNQSLFRRRIAVASLDYSPEWGDCSGVWQNPQSLGREAVSFLVSQIQNNQHGLPPVPSPS